MSQVSLSKGRGKRLPRAALTAGAIFLVLLTFNPVAYSVLQGHAPSPLVLQGHSPIVLFAKGPDGRGIGCTAIPCTSRTSENFLDNLTRSSGRARYFFSTNAIFIAKPLIGNWTLIFFGTGGSTPANFTLTATSCPESNGDINNQGHHEPGCSNLTGNFYDPDDKPVTVTLLNGTVTGGEVGSVAFTVGPNGTITF